MVQGVLISAATLRQLGRVLGKRHESMDPFCFVSKVQAGGGDVMVWGNFSWLLFFDHAHPYFISLYQSFKDHFQQDNALCHNYKTQVILRCFLEYDKFTLLNWSHQTPDHNPIDPLGCGGTRDLHHV